ncbi:non-heme iron oxygenase ferredoxin subunit [Nocardioides sp. 1609]|uniref:non-heme iron oxygenase ferredoxin subunit n=1 Tax=Nocardioides sp. 1609 TaxID=2508327 RepID=UPI0032AEF248
MSAGREMTFQRACALADVPTDEALAVTIGEYDVAIARDGEELLAIQDLCTHAHVALSEGDVERDGGSCTIECWLHGSRFDLRTGQPSGLPATEPVATFPVEVREDGVYVDTTTTLNGATPQ